MTHRVFEYLLEPGKSLAAENQRVVKAFAGLGDEFPGRAQTGVDDLGADVLAVASGDVHDPLPGVVQGLLALALLMGHEPVHCLVRRRQAGLLKIPQGRARSGVEQGQLEVAKRVEGVLEKPQIVGGGAVVADGEEQFFLHWGNSC